MTSRQYIFIMRYVFKKKVFYCIVVVGILILFLHPNMNAKRTYDYIEKQNILSNLYEETADNFTSTSMADCEYYDVLGDETTLPITLVDADLVEGHRIREGGEFDPIECKSKFSSAIIVPYRDRPEELRGFLVYMHTFLRRQRIHYRIYVVEQVDSRPFNRAKLLNVGAVAAMQAGFPCLILHDVDLLPLMSANLYACTKRPRHMSSSINRFRFVLPYLNLFGGAIAITSKQFKDINGMSNEFFGWKGEDDDLYLRLAAHRINLCRFQPELSRYHMVAHNSHNKGSRGTKVLSNTKERMEVDGLSTLQYTEVATVLHPLFTHIMADL